MTWLLDYVHPRSIWPDAKSLISVQSSSVLRALSSPRDHPLCSRAEQRALTAPQDSTAGQHLLCHVNSWWAAAFPKLDPCCSLPLGEHILLSMSWFHPYLGTSGCVRCCWGWLMAGCFCSCSCSLYPEVGWSCMSWVIWFSKFRPYPVSLSSLLPNNVLLQ